MNDYSFNSQPIGIVASGNGNGWQKNHDTFPGVTHGTVPPNFPDLPPQADNGNNPNIPEASSFAFLLGLVCIAVVALKRFKK